MLTAKRAKAQTSRVATAPSPTDRTHQKEHMWRDPGRHVRFSQLNHIISLYAFKPVYSRGGALPRPAGLPPPLGGGWRTLHAPHWYNGNLSKILGSVKGQRVFGS